MIDSLTKQPIRVAADSTGAVCITVQPDQVRDLFRELNRADIAYQTTVNLSTFYENVEAAQIIYLDRADADAAQRVLDQAAVKTSIGFVDGSHMVTYHPQELFDRFESLQREGLEGNDLFHELLGDDWGPPPRYAELEGQRVDGTPFHVTLSYDSRSRRRR